MYTFWILVNTMTIADKEGGFMKKVGTIVLSFLVALSLAGCNADKNSDVAIASKDVPSTSQTTDNQDADSNAPLAETVKREQQLDGNMIVTPYVQLIVTDDGKVLGRGNNPYGQLGNGERVNTETWTEVQGLENVVGIYSLGDVGRTRDYSYGHCYALTDSGELYRWGGNILVPEKVTIFPKVKEVRYLAYHLLVKCESGESYIMASRFNKDHDDSVYSYNSLPDDAYLYSGFFYGGGYLVYSNNKLSYIKVSNDPQTDSFDEIRALEDTITDTIPVDISEGIKNVTSCSYDGFGGSTITTDSGNVIGLKLDESKKGIVVEKLDKENVKKASINYTTFVLFDSGKLSASGDNKGGQLGDGTLLDYDDGYLDIDAASFSDFNYVSGDMYCIALDQDYNVWGWGKGFGVRPTVIIENTEFAHS